MSVQKDVNGAILKTKVKNKITMQTYEEHGHLSDTFRYVCCDVLREQFLSFSNRRKRNLYARDGTIHFYNPDTECRYARDIVCGDKWHIADVALRETSSTDEIRDMLIKSQGGQTIIECAPAYFRFVRELRKDIPNARALNETADIDRRIAATSDFVKNHLLFNERQLNDNAEYSLFMSNMLDYNPGSESKEASAVLSGFIQFVVKFDF